MLSLARSILSCTHFAMQHHIELVVSSTRQCLEAALSWLRSRANSLFGCSICPGGHLPLCHYILFQNTSIHGYNDNFMGSNRRRDLQGGPYENVGDSLLYFTRILTHDWMPMLAAQCRGVSPTEFFWSSRSRAGASGLDSTTFSTLRRPCPAA